MDYRRFTYCTILMHPHGSKCTDSVSTRNKAMTPQALWIAEQALQALADPTHASFVMRSRSLRLRCGLRTWLVEGPYAHSRTRAVSVPRESEIQRVARAHECTHRNGPACTALPEHQLKRCNREYAQGRPVSLLPVFDDMCGVDPHRTNAGEGL